MLQAGALTLGLDLLKTLCSNKNFPFSYNTIDPNSFHTQLKFGGFLLPTLLVHWTNFTDISDHSAHGAFCGNMHYTHCSQFTALKGYNYWLAQVCYSEYMKGCLVPEKNLCSAVSKGERQTCSPPAVSRRRPLHPRGTPLTGAGCGRSQCEYSTRPVVTSGGAECRSAFEKQIQNKSVVNSEDQ